MLSLVAIAGNMQAAFTLPTQDQIIAELKHAGRTGSNGAYMTLAGLIVYKVVWPYVSSGIDKLPGLTQQAEAAASSGASSLAATAQADLAKLAAATQAGVTSFNAALATQSDEQVAAIAKAADEANRSRLAKRAAPVKA